MADKHTALLATRHRRFQKANKPDPPKLRKRTRPHRNRQQIAAAIRRSYGNWSLLAVLLDCAPSTIQNILRRPENEHLMELFVDERRVAIDHTEASIFNIAHNDPNTGERRKASQFILTHLHPDYKQGPTSKVVVEGGEKPIDVRGVVLQIPAEVMSMSVEDRLAVLEAADDKERELAKDDE